MADETRCRCYLGEAGELVWQECVAAENLQRNRWANVHDVIQHTAQATRRLDAEARAKGLPDQRRVLSDWLLSFPEHYGEEISSASGFNRAWATLLPFDVEAIKAEARAELLAEQAAAEPRSPWIPDQHYEHLEQRIEWLEAERDVLATKCADFELLGRGLPKPETEPDLVYETELTKAINAYPSLDTEQGLGYIDGFRYCWNLLWPKPPEPEMSECERAFRARFPDGDWPDSDRAKGWASAWEAAKCGTVGRQIYQLHNTTTGSQP